MVEPIIRYSSSLFGILRKLRADGVGIVYVSHRLPEVFRIADRKTPHQDPEKAYVRARGKRRRRWPCRNPPS